MKRWTAVEVVWHDAHGGDDGWRPLAKGCHEPAMIRTVGMLHTENKKGVTVVLSRVGDRGGVVSGYLFVPVDRLVSITPLASC